MISAPHPASIALSAAFAVLVCGDVAWAQAATKATTTRVAAAAGSRSGTSAKVSGSPKATSASGSTKAAASATPSRSKAVADSRPAMLPKTPPPPPPPSVILQQPTLPRVNVPTLPRQAYSRYPWKTDIVATVFWVGEEPTENNPTPNNKSSWDTDWQGNFGGYDDPDPTKRGSNFCPANFTPKLNPFYVALPYNDCVNHTAHKPEAARVIPWFKDRYVKAGRTVLRGTWIAIRYGNRVCYAQWEDCGPFITDDHDYVFGNARPRNKDNGGAGIDISPAVRDYLGIGGKGKCDWRFVDVSEVPAGPWRSLGTNNHFVKAQQPAQVRDTKEIASRLEELKRQRDEYFKRAAGLQ